MYLPAHFKVEDFEKLAAFLDANSFATVVSHSNGHPFASHLPVLLDRETEPPGRLQGHMARANPQWQHFSNGEEALVVFHGPHAYVSPTWYESELMVPTWNYVAVHAYGMPRVIVDADALEELIDKTIRKFEHGRTRPWTGELPADFKNKMFKAIVGFEISVTRIEGKFKLNQNRTPNDRRGVYEALSQSVQPEERQIAELMRTEGLV